MDRDRGTGIGGQGQRDSERDMDGTRGQEKVHGQ